MPKVPVQEAPSVMPQGGDTPYQFTSASAEAFGAQQGRAMQGLGAQVGHLGDVLATHAIQLQDRTNQATATDLYTQATIEVGNLDAQYGQLEGKARADALPEYQKGLLKIQEKYRSQAPNVEVSRQFDNDFKRRMAYSIVDESKKAAGAMKQYNNKSQAARISLAEQDAALSARDDQRFELALAEVHQSVDALGRENSWGPDEKEVFLRKQIDGLYETRFKAMAISEPFRAKESFNAHKNEISGPAQLKIENDINNGIVKSGSRLDAQEIWSRPSSSLKERVKEFEGYRSKAYGDYKQFSIGYGTRATSPNEVISRPEAEMRLDTELQKASDFVETVNPNLDRGTKEALTSLTFNAGTKWAESGLGKAVRDGDVAAIKERFVQYNQAGGMPNAALISRRQVEAGWIGTQGMQDATSAAKLEGALAEAKSRADQRFPNDPGFAALYEDTLSSRLKNLYATDQKVRREQRQGRFTTVMSELIPQQDGSAVSQLEQLSPKAQEAYFDMEADQKRRVLRQLDSNAKRDVPLTPERYSKFQEIMGKSVTAPDEFLEVVPGENDLPRTLQSQIFAKQRSMEGKLANTTKINSALRTVAPMLNDAGIFASKTDTTRNASYNQFVGAFDAKLKEYEDQNKKFPTEEEQRKIAAGLLADRPGTGWFTDDRMFEVPTSFANEYTPKFKERFGRSPTAGELFRLYQMSKNSGG